MQPSVLVSRAALAGALLLACLSPAWADPSKVPGPRFSTVTPVLVGCPSGNAITTCCPGTGALERFAPLFATGASGHPEADFDGSGSPIGLGDFAVFAREFASGVHGTYCP